MKIHDKLSKIGIAVFLGSIAFIICMQSPQNPILKNGADITTDSGVFQCIAYIMKHGGVPYRDTFDHKGILTYFINYLGMLLSEQHGIWYVEFIFMLITVIVSYRLARLFGERFAALLTVFSVYSQLFLYFEGGNYTEEFALPFIAVGAYVFLKYLLTKKMIWYEVIICGICCGSVLLLRPNMIAVWTVYPIFIAGILIYEKKISELMRCFLWFFGGIALVAIPCAGYLMINHAFHDFIDQYIIFNFAYQSTSIITHYDVFYMFLNNPVTIGAAAILIFSLFLNRGKKNKSVLWSSLIVIFVSLLFQSMSGREYGHYGMILLPLLVFPIAVTCGICMKCIRKEPVGLALGALIILFYFGMYLPKDLWYGGVRKVITDYGSRNNEYYSEDVQVTRFIKSLTDEGDTISVYGNKDIYYVKSDRLPASKYSYQMPIAEVRESIFDEYLKDLYEKKPEVVVITAKKDHKIMGNYDEKLKKFLSHMNYTLVDDSIYLIYQAK